MEKNAIVDLVRSKAEGYFERGEFFCSESVVHTINELLGWPYSEDVVRMASGFPIGMGKSGCLCGAVSGGSMALGMAYGRKHGEPMNEKMFPIAKELHDYIKSLYGSTCCRVLVRNYEFASPERKAHCVKITGEVAAWIASKLLDDPEISQKINPNFK
ncbi:C_GCAxxG_C_C family probable redox protein [Caloramator quimbayensis]|uniref:C_GCAxxG_C_C family probable redox protein n=1 Tax=Caloramator quimbayensis TaxID=1147123 RepID=A0A1T4WN84_9CLOT|nr:C-GCAxxG-C-C family protein [Caloramator quimbayensis]SKA78091.1 C_GCAxxG_C_C family probable redox protein [Caloramator quimbayensis]